MSKPVLEECVGTVCGVAGAVMGRHVAGPTGATVGGAMGQMTGVYIANRIDNRKRKAKTSGPRKQAHPKQAHHDSPTEQDLSQAERMALRPRLPGGIG